MLDEREGFKEETMAMMTTADVADLGEIDEFRAAAERVMPELIFTGPERPPGSSNSRRPLPIPATPRRV